MQLGVQHTKKLLVPFLKFEFDLVTYILSDNLNLKCDGICFNAGANMDSDNSGLNLSSGT